MNNKRVTVTTDKGFFNMQANSLRLHGDTLYVYQQNSNTDTLIGMFKENLVLSAYISEQGKRES